MQRAVNTVSLAFQFVLAVDNGRELFLLDVLECLCTTNVAGVRIDKDEWFNLRHPCNDATDGDESSKMCALHIAHGPSLRPRKGLEIEVTVDESGRVKRHEQTSDALSSKQMPWKLVLVCIL